jgi:acetoin utilization protein AcuC
MPAAPISTLYAAGSKLNIPLPPGSNDTQFMLIWPKLESFIRRHSPEFIIMQAGTYNIEGDPITHLALSEQAHAHVTQRLCTLAEELCHGRLLVMGGSGYKLDNIAKTWSAVIAALASHDCCLACIMLVAQIKQLNIAWAMIRNNIHE